MDKLHTQAAKEMIWRDHLVRHAASGTSIAAFCRAEQISQANFYAWRTKLRGDASGLTVPSTHGAFIDLGAVSGPVDNHETTHRPTPALTTAAPAPRAQANSSIELRIDLGSGVVLTITRR